MSEPVGVLIVDDDALVRAGLSTIVGSDPQIQILGQAENGLRGIELAQRLNPQVVLMDIRMPQLDGLGALERLQALLPEVKVLILTTFGEEEYIDRALDLGASGFLLKSSSPEELIAAVHAVASGAAALSPRVAHRVIQRVRTIDASGSQQAKQSLESLTSRELEVLTLVAHGASNADIAAQLHLTQATVKGYVTTILTKLSARNRVQAALTAFQAGLIS